jgi:hypothetical protein
MSMGELSCIVLKPVLPEPFLFLNRENVDGGPPGGARAGDLGAQRLRSPPLGQGGEWLQNPRDKCSKSS